MSNSVEVTRRVRNCRGLLPLDVEWSYQDKRFAQEIAPRVYLGPYSAACQEDHLRELGITHVIIFRAPEEERIVRPRFESWIRYEIIEARDTVNQSLIPLFPKVREAVDTVLAADPGNRILLQGTVGMSRSAAFAIAYVMEKFALDWEAAIYYVSQRRHCVALNENFRWQLREYDLIWKTRQRASNVGIGSGGMSRKRPLEDDTHEYERNHAPAPVLARNNAAPYAGDACNGDVAMDNG
ncbi:unnamed protein product [Amoebophrya sp. A25]|nr:unnamed protein product [Amoebophrya sp. A25]|eukprot:GSA25T00024695001.1